MTIMKCPKCSGLGKIVYYETSSAAGNYEETCSSCGGKGYVAGKGEGVKVRIPREIKVGAHTYSIGFSPHLHCDEARYGNCNHRTQEIQLWAESPPSLRDESLIHEVIHIGELCYRIDVSDSDIDRIAHLILEFLVRNLGIEFDWSEISKEP